MAITPTTLQTLITQLRQRTNMENNQFVTDSELTGYLNNRLAILDGILISKFNKYKLTAAIVSVNPGTNLVALPNDFLKLNGMDVVVSPNVLDGYLRMDQIAWEHRDQYNNPNVPLILTIYALKYYLEGQYVMVLPGQIAQNYQYRMWYTPDYVPLVNLSDTLQPYMDSQLWYQYAVTAAAVDVLLKQDMDAQQFSLQEAQLRDHILKLSAPNRNATEPASITNTHSYGYGGNGGGYGWNW